MDKTGNAWFLQNYTANFPNRVLTSLATLPAYARLIIWPAGLHIEWDFPVSTTLLAWQTMIGALMVGMGFLQILRGQLQRGLALSFGLLWFGIALSPYSNIVFPIDAILSENWMYMPTMGLFLGAAETASCIFRKRRPTAQLLVLVAAFSLGTATFLQNEAWRNPETLYNSVQKNGGFVGRIAVGSFYLERGEFDKAVEQLQFEINHPDDGRQWPRGVRAHLQLVAAWLHIQLDDSDIITVDQLYHALPSCQHIPEIVGELGKILQKNPDYYWAHQALAVIYHDQGNSTMADFHQRQAEALVQKQGKDVAALSSYQGMSYMDQGEFDKAIEEFQYDIDHPDGRSRVSQADIRWKLAMAWLHLRPNKDDGTYPLQMSALPSCRHIPEAIDELDKTLQDNPDFYWAHQALAILYRYQGNNNMADFHDRKTADILKKQGNPGP
jgi:tetratricopeptide (TPR) repeat protein